MMAFKLKDKGDLKYLVISPFEESGLVRHGFSTRLGGVSQGTLASLNLGKKKSDRPGAVLKNFSLFCDALDIDIQNLVASDQVHGTSVYLASNEDRGKGILRETDIKSKDALITRKRHVALVTFFADCVPLFFLDMKTPAIGVAHAGWRGTVRGMGPGVVGKMMEVFNSQPKDILAGIGPCINKCCYEIDEPLATEFKNAFEYGEELLEFKRPGHWMLDLVLANKLQLEDAGILPENILTCDYCTSCNNDLFFSHRADRGNTGSLAAIIELK